MVSMVSLGVMAVSGDIHDDEHWWQWQTSGQVVGHMNGHEHGGWQTH